MLALYDSSNSNIFLSYSYMRGDLENSFFKPCTTTVLSHHSLIQQSCRFGPSACRALKTALYSKMCIGCACSSTANPPRWLVSEVGTGCSSVRVTSSTLSSRSCPSVRVDFHFPCMCAPHATPEASVLSTSCRTLTRSCGPHDLPMSCSGIFPQ